MESTIASSSIFDADFDKNQLPPIDQKRLAFVNHFLIDTAKFLNTFLVNCENKFVALESRLRKINAELTVIESKIFQGELKNPANVDEKQEDNEQNKSDLDTVDRKSASDSDKSSQIATEEDNNNRNQETAATTQPETATDDGVRVCDDVRYDKYFKMKQFGVPAEAVKLKMSAEGLDPSLLDQPNRILEDGIRKTTVAENE